MLPLLQYYKKNTNSFRLQRFLTKKLVLNNESMDITELKSTEYAPFYKGYIEVLGGASLEQALKETSKLLEDVSKKINHTNIYSSYAPGKWTVAEVLLHIIDTERVFQYRALRIGRGDQTNLPGFDQDIFMANCNANKRDLKSLLTEFAVVRQSTLLLFNQFGVDDLRKIGFVGGNEMSVRALGFIICGHVKHHVNILNDRYLI